MVKCSIFTLCFIFLFLGSANGNTSPRLYKLSSGGYIQFGTNYCVFSTTQEIFKFGYNQRDYNIAAVKSSTPSTLNYLGKCSIRNLPNAFFRVAKSMYLSNGIGGACTFRSSEHLISCGGSSKVYERAVVLLNLPTYMENIEPCACGKFGPEYTWNGPEVRLEWPGGKPKFNVGGDLLDPYWITMNVQGLQNTGPNQPVDWSHFDFSLKKAAQYGMKIVEVNLGWTGSKKSLIVLRL